MFLFKITFYSLQYPGIHTSLKGNVRGPVSILVPSTCTLTQVQRLNGCGGKPAENG